MGGVWNFGFDKLLRFQSLISYCGILKEKNVEGNADDGVLLMIFQGESLKDYRGYSSVNKTSPKEAVFAETDWSIRILVLWRNWNVACTKGWLPSLGLVLAPRYINSLPTAVSELASYDLRSR